jgi:hypothetical protein
MIPSPAQDEKENPESTRWTTDPRPFSIAQIRALGQKANHRTEGNWLARRWARPTAVFGTWLVLRLGLSAHTVTALAAFAWLGEGVCLSFGSIGWFTAAISLGYLGFWLDHVDGQVARVTRTSSVDGIFLDFWTHTAHALVRAFGLGWGLHEATGQPAALFAGMVAAFGWTMIAHANDAMYKALFAELKALRDRGVAVRMRPDPTEVRSTAISRPIALRRKASRMLAKGQEPHVVLIVLTIICGILWLDRTNGERAWAIALGFWAVASPLVAVARLSRFVRSGVVSERFQDWFETELSQPLGEDASNRI